MDDSLSPTARPTASLDELLDCYSGQGRASFRGPDGSAWIGHELGGLCRYPVLPGPSPDTKTINALLAKRKIWILDFIQPPTPGQTANCFLYLFNGREGYALEQLGTSGRRDARKSLRELDIKWVSHQVVMATGYPVYLDCRSRVGLSDVRPADFAKKFGGLAETPGMSYLGAWKGEQLVAFMTMQVVGDTVAIAAYSGNAFRSSCANDGLIAIAMEYWLNQPGIVRASYGLSSVQEIENNKTLHVFKEKVGFEAIPVLRSFLCHPVLVPLLNSGTRHGIAMLHRAFPRNRILSKANGTLGMMVDALGVSESQ